MDLQATADKLRMKMIFLGVNDDDLMALAEIAQLQNFQAGDIIAEENQQGDRMYIITDGEVEVVKKDGDEEVLVTTLYGGDSLMKTYAGDFFGEMSLLDAEPRSATVRAVGEVELYQLMNGDLRKLFMANHELNLLVISNIARILSRRLREFYRHEDNLL